MSKEMSENNTPEAIELEAKRRELASLEEEVAERELELATSRARLHHFEATYLQEVGIYLTELDELIAEITEKIAADSSACSRASLASDFAVSSPRESAGAHEARVDGCRLTPCPSGRWHARGGTFLADASATL